MCICNETKYYSDNHLVICLYGPFDMTWHKYLRSTKETYIYGELRIKVVGICNLWDFMLKIPFALPYLYIALIILWQLFYVSKYCIYGTIIYDCNFPKWAINFQHNQSIEFKYIYKVRLKCGDI